MPSATQLSIIFSEEAGGDRVEALESIAQQRFVRPEVLTVDRGDTAADACNQAVARARGDWILFVGSGDRLVGDVVLSETLNWMKKTEAGVVAGESATDRGRLWRLQSRPHPIRGDFTPRAATFYRRTLFEENGGFDAALSAMAVYDFNLRLWKSRVRFKPIPLRIAACAAERRFDRQAALEEIRVRHRYFPAWRCWPWDAASLLRCVTPGGSA